MKIENLLKHNLFTKTPGLSGKDILSFLEFKYSDYIGNLEKLELDNPVTTEINNNLGTIKNLSEIVIESIAFYLKGQPSIAYKTLSSTMDDIWENHLKLFSSKNLQNLSPSLFRCRVAKQGEVFTKDDLFHIPFEKRNLIQNQRYSINGYPSLYLGSSVLVCWLELNEPPIHELATSRYYLNHRNFNLLDLAIDYKVILNGIETIKDDNYYQKWINEGIYTKFILFPLVLAVSLKSNPQDNFKVEFIIPQLLLEWARNSKKVECIKYFSTRNFCNIHNTIHLTNFVFPVKSFSTTGYCSELDKIFSRSEPYMIKDPDLYIGNSYSSEVLSKYNESSFFEVEKNTR